MLTPSAPVAQLDSASVFGTEGCRFESCRAYFDSSAGSPLGETFRSRPIISHRERTCITFPPAAWLKKLTRPAETSVNRAARVRSMSRGVGSLAYPLRFFRCAMSILVPETDRLSPVRRPPGRPKGYHRWSDLLFLHWRLPPEPIAALLPPGLTLDTWQGDAWVGLVPFRMSSVRPWWSPWGAAFPETNVRTYVHCRGRDPGVWFFSLEASHRLAVCIARACWGLNYHRARMNVERQGDRLRYRSRRTADDGVGCRIEATLDGAAFHAQPETLEHFLVERYVLYTRSRAGRLFRGRVHHAPYLLRPARLVRLEESLLAANGIVCSQPPCHAVACGEVDVEVFPLVATRE